MKNIQKRRAKIVATIGPASASPDKINALIKAGMNVARLNFSHGTYEAHGEVIETIRAESKKLGKHIAILQDLCGPKMRIGPVEDDGFSVTEGKTITVQFCEDVKKHLGNASTIYIDAFNH